MGSSRRPNPDIYTAMLAVAVVAILVAIVLLALEMNQYEFDISPVGLRDTGGYFASQQTGLAAAAPRAALRQRILCRTTHSIRATDPSVAAWFA